MIMTQNPLQLNTPEEIAELLASQVREDRLRREWTQQTFADRSGVSLPTLRRYERTARTSIEHFRRFCHVVGRLDELASYLQPPPANTLAELESRAYASNRKRGRK